MKEKQFYELFSQRMFDFFKKLFEHFSLSRQEFLLSAFGTFHSPEIVDYFFFFFSAGEKKLKRYKNDLKGNKEEEKKRESH